MAVLAAGALVAPVLVAGCGRDEERGEAQAPTATAPAASAPPTTAPTPTPTRPSGTATSPPARTEATSPEDAEGGAGDEEAIRTPVALSVARGRVDPRRVVVPPFLAVEVTLSSADGAPHRVRIGDRPAIPVPPEGVQRRLLEGFRPGRHPVRVDGTAAGALVAADEAGP